MSQYPYDPMAAPPERNGLGLAGFICSLLGLITAGILCPIGLLISLIALGRRPRGFATAGVVLGLVGSCGGLVIAAFVFSVALAGAAAVSLAVLMSDPVRLEVSTDFVTIASAVQQYRQYNRVLPASLDELDLENSVLTDPWSNPYEYHFTDTEDLGFDVVCAGEDGEFGTDDDARFSKLDELWANFWEDFKKQQKELANREPVVITIGGDEAEEREQAGDHDSTDKADRSAQPEPVEQDGGTEEN